MRKLITATAVLALMAPGVTLAQSQATGQFNVSMEVTGQPAVTQPTIQISGLIDYNFGNLTQSDLTTGGVASLIESFCVLIDNPSSLTVAPKITFDQPGTAVFNSDIGARFALVGPARIGTSSGLAQVPFDIFFDRGGLGAYPIQRGALITEGYNAGSPAYGCGGTGPFYDALGLPGGGAQKPRVGPRRAAAADALNPAGNYSATVRVTVTPL